VAPTTSTLRLVAQLPDGPGTCAVYHPGAVLPSGWHRVDVRAHCHLHQAEWTEALTRWHGELMAVVVEATPWAWLIPGSRLHMWHEPVRPFLFALGLLCHFREQPGDEVLAVGCPDEVGAYVRELSGGSIEVLGERAPSERAGVVGRRTLRRVVETVSILRRVLAVRSDRAPQTDVDLLVLSVGLSVGSISQHGDHYFGRALDNVTFRTQWLYQLRGFSDRLGVEGALRASGRSCLFDYRLATWVDVLRVARTAARLRRQMRTLAAGVPVLWIEDSVSRLFPQRFFRDLFLNASPLSELVLHRVVKRVIGTFPPRAVCYPYEEKGLERALLMACASASKPITTIGFAHAAYNSGHLFLRELPTDQTRPPRPSVLAAAGPGFGPWLAGENGRRDVVVTVGSPRWMGAAAVSRSRQAGAPLKVLFLTGFPTELLELAEWSDRCPDLFAGCEVTIRPNPQEWHLEQQAAFARLCGAASVTMAGDVPLHRQIDAADVVLFCATSAVAEAIWHGRVAVFVEVSDLWVTDPLHGDAMAAGVPRCATPAELKEALRDVAALDPAEYDRMVTAQRVTAERIYAPFDPNAFRALVMGESPA
jgi:hypothetical protein